MAAPLVAAAAKAAGKAIAKGAAKKAAGSDSGKKAIRVGCMAAAGVVILPVFLFLAVLSALINALMQQPPGCANTGSSSGPEVAALAAYSLNVAGVNDADKITVMIAIADAESGLVGDKIGPGNASGLWQITPAQYPQGFPPAQSDPNFILDPANNAIAAVYRTGGPGLPNLSVWTGNAAYDAFAKGGGVTTDSKGNTTINWSVAKTFNDPAGSFQKARDAVAAASTTPGASPSAAPAGGCCGSTPGAPGPGGAGGVGGNQLANVRIIIGVAKARGISIFGQEIAVATARQESNFLNYANSKIPETLALPHDAVGSDGYSAGIFQQQTGPFGNSWGTPAQVMNPAYAAGKFLDRMVQVPNWQNLPLTVVAQTVQVSAYPNAYAQWQGLATQLVAANQDAPPITIDTGGKGGNTGSGGASCATGGVGGCINPIQPGKWGPARTDMGVDWLPNGPNTPVLAICDAVVTYSQQNGTGWPNWQCNTCGAFMDYQITSGAKKGYCIYVAENLTNMVPQGTTIKAGQVIASAQPGYAWTEWGWARCAGMGRYGGPITPYNGAADGSPMPGGKAFARFLNELGAKCLMDPGPGPDVI